MKKIKKMVAMLLSIVMVMSVMSIGAFAANEKLTFVITDENGNEIKEIELEYKEDVAQAYEQNKKMRWATTTYYNLANGNVTIGGSTQKMIVQSTYHFNANSSGRLYYYGEGTSSDVIAVDLYDITNDTYVGTASLYDQGSNVHYRSGYFPGLSTSSSHYYSFGLSSDSAFSNYYGVMSWNSL